MQKKIIALAVAGLMSGAAFAQSNVTIYGRVDIGFNHTSSSDTNRKSRSALDDGLAAGSRIGFRGTEDLGNGLKAGFVLEYGLQNDINATLGVGGGATARQQFLSLSSDSMGTFSFGRQYTPQFGLMARMDPFAVGTVGDVGSNARGVWMITPRLDNLTAYASPSFGGFNVVAGFTADGDGDEAATVKGADSTNTKVWAINPNYRNGPIDIGFNYHRITSETADAKARTYDLAASYNFGVAKVSAAFGSDRAEALGLDLAKNKKYMLGVSAPMGNGVLKASYSRMKDSEWDEKVTKWAVGYDYALSKRTTVYAAYAKMNQSDGLEGSNLFSLDATGANEYMSGLNVGIGHNF